MFFPFPATRVSKAPVACIVGWVNLVCFSQSGLSTVLALRGWDKKEEGKMTVFQCLWQFI